MSKERLEEIEVKYSILTVFSEKNGMEYTEVDVKDLVFLIQNGFKQAERVQELEEENVILKATRAGNEEHIDVLHKQNKRYREALEFYADENNYREQELKGIVPPRPITFKPILHDYGSIARQALEGEKYD